MRDFVLQVNLELSVKLGGLVEIKRKSEDGNAAKAMSAPLCIVT